MNNNRYTNLVSDLKRIGCTSIRFRKRGEKEYITTVGGDKDSVKYLLTKITRYNNIYLTSGGWPTKNFTFRVV